MTNSRVDEFPTQDDYMFALDDPSLAPTLGMKVRTVVVIFIAVGIVFLSCRGF